MAISKDKDDMIWVTSLVSSTTREGVVELTWGDKRAQLSVREAREHSLAVLEIAEAAETDAFIAEFLEKEVGMDLQRSVGMMQAFRTYREKRLKEKAH
jgi:hypothetical protein